MAAHIYCPPSTPTHPTPPAHTGVFDGKPAPYYQSPWMSGMYVGQLDSEHEGHVFPGWHPNRDPTSKW